MKDEQLILKLIQSHKELEHFDYSIAVNWAIDLIRQGKETENVLMLASFSQPIDRFEISTYVTNVLDDLGLEELDYESAVIAETHYHLNEILSDREIRKNLQSLYQLCVDNDYESGLMTFYLIYHGWDELEEMGVNYYFDGADLYNIEDELKKEARKWIDKYVHGKEDESIEQQRREEKEKTLPTTMAIPNKGFIAKLKGWFS
ncbi:hypothetical protein DFQ11_1216 [Winogradskyella epiphytica]|uniref:Uncharacterized protein n=1 Tax=Winogradskyella epiphytica TaxID=262005 RepID=A0A2V4WTQ6_9FLAO|nr:hypothetical protein [Winogradskyella epiphytica]PYE78777.1 hypothetical protein DFQ11_1216 [Winogradskyella epiphytica]GGW75195.1 hypothetical protein GCM10008085_28920 [Winogradskyella epiphytica]